VAAGVAVAADLGERGATRRLQRTTALNRSRVEQDEVVAVSGRALREHAHQPLDRLGQARATLVQSVLTRQSGEQVAELAPGGPQEAPIGRDPDQHLGDAEGDDLGVAQRAPRIGRALGQKVVGRAVDTDQEQVEVGVHRGLLVDDVEDTADFDLPPLVPIATPRAVASII
jgi:hypothetical protein